MNILEDVVEKKLGCLMTSDCSNDKKVKHEGFPNYQVEPKIDTFPVA